jgi:glucokinase
MLILAGDVGGTKSNLALFRETELQEALVSPGSLQPAKQRRFQNENYSTLNEVILEFLGSLEPELRQTPVTGAGFGLAGPVVRGVCRTSNLPWVADTKELQGVLGIERVRLINDLVANGFGISLLSGDQLVAVREAPGDPTGHGALISPGTGLGEAFLYRKDGRFIPVASEGGHSTFSPSSELEVNLLHYLMEKWDHVSFERLISGPGLVNIYSFLRDTEGGEEPAWLKERIAEGDPAAVISEAAMDGESGLCEEALDLFVSVYGSEAGNLGLKFKALGGVFLGGGITPKIIEKLQTGLFVESFLAKGRMKGLLEEMPILAVMEPKTALYGAARGVLEKN